MRKLAVFKSEATAAELKDVRVEIEERERNWNEVRGESLYRCAGHEQQLFLNIDNNTCEAKLLALHANASFPPYPIFVTHKVISSDYRRVTYA